MEIDVVPSSPKAISECFVHETQLRLDRFF